MMRKMLVVLALVGLSFALVQPVQAGIQNYDLEPSFGFRVALQYAHSDLAASDGGTPQIPIAGTRDVSAATQANVEYVMPFSGRIIGISAASNAALTVGAAHFEVTVNGSSVTGTTVTLRGSEGTSSPSNRQRNYTNLVDRFSKSTPYTFSAGDRIGVSMRTATSVLGGAPSPNTADLVVTVIVDQNTVE